MVPELIVAASVTAVAAAVRGTWSPCGLSMLSSITPFGERARGHRYGLTCAWFVLGAALGGAALGVVAAVGAWAVSPLAGAFGGWLVAAAVIAALVCLASDAGVGPVRLPLLPRQVDETWLDVYRRWIYAAGFGVQIGAGLTTYVMTAATYLVVVLAVLSGSPGWALVTGLVFGTTRGLMVTLGVLAPTPARLRDLHRALEGRAATSLRVVMAVQAAVALALAAAAGGPLAAGAVAAVVLVVVVLARARRRPAEVTPSREPARVAAL